MITLYATCSNRILFLTIERDGIPLNRCVFIQLSVGYHQIYFDVFATMGHDATVITQRLVRNHEKRRTHLALRVQIETRTTFCKELWFQR